MKIEVKGHSGCQIDVVEEGRELFVYKSTRDPKYLERLAAQADKQILANQKTYQHIRVPKIYDVERTADQTSIKMQYIYSKNFIEFFENAGFEQIDYLIGALEYFVELEIESSELKTVPAQIFRDKFKDIRKKVEANQIFSGNTSVISILARCQNVFDNLQDLTIPVGTCHGDLTFSNILFNGNNYYLIDFLDSFVETPLQDIVKIRQDTAYRWSQLMYIKKYDAVRLHIICDRIDREIDTYFAQKYRWYRDNYGIMQLMNILRILPYAHEEKVISYLQDILNGLLDGNK